MRQQIFYGDKPTAAKSNALSPYQALSVRARRDHKPHDKP